MKHMTRKATRHVNQNENLIFEKSSPGKAAWKLPPLDVPEVDTAKLLGKSERKDLGNMPEVSEIEIIRHFTRLSTWNYAIDLGMYPLGSCTMKYNPRVNEVVSRLEGIANGHPYQPEKISQGALRIINPKALRARRSLFPTLPTERIPRLRPWSDTRLRISSQTQRGWLISPRC